MRAEVQGDKLVRVQETILLLVVFRFSCRAYILKLRSLTEVPLMSSCPTVTHPERRHRKAAHLALEPRGCPFLLTSKSAS